MSDAKGIFWLSSYPKSGNTWFRIVLSRLLNQATDLHYINNIDRILGSPMLVSRAWMNQVLAVDSMLLDEDELEQIRPAAHQWQGRQMKHTAYVKTHDAYTYLADRTPLFPADGCLGAIYFIRNPLDVAISLAHHAKCSVDASIYMMGNKEFTVPFDTQNDKQLPQKLLTWSMHVQSWTGSTSINVLVLRYEDMFVKPIETFRQGIEFLNLQVSSAALDQAIDDASFNKLQQYEKQFGFKEKPPVSGQFFRKGIVGDWQKTLTEVQIQKVIHDHAEVMRVHGYLDAENRPIII